MNVHFTELHRLLNILYDFSLKGPDGLLNPSDERKIGQTRKSINAELAKLQARDAIDDHLRREIHASVSHLDVTTVSAAHILQRLMDKL